MKKTKPQKVFNVCNIVVLIALTLLFIIPYWMIFMASVTDEVTLISNGYSLFPKKFSLYAYDFIFRSDPLLVRSIFNSIEIAVVGTAITTVVCFLYAYPLSRKYLRMRKFFTIYVVITMLFGGGLIPSFLVVTTFFDDSIWAIIIPQAMSAWYAILMRNYFMSIPEALEEAARMDGASHFRVLFQIFLPLAKPLVATIVLFTAVSLWNNWTGPMLYISSKEKFPIQYLVQQLMTSVSSIYGQGGGGGIVPSESIKMASVVLASLPIIIVYPFLQKYFINGTIVGSVKE